MKLFYLLLFNLLILNNLSVHAQTYYPDIISLDGSWKFCVDTSGIFAVSDLEKDAEWRTVKVPLSWQAQFSDLRDYQGVAWYKKDFSIRNLKEDEVILINFNAVDYLSEIYINGIFAGRNEGGYTPFNFDITKYIKPGRNEVCVRVLDPKTTKEGTEGISYWNIPHGKQSWYIQTSGIWQSAFLKIEQEKFIKQVHITSSIDGNFTIEGIFNRSLLKSGNKNLLAKIIDTNKNIVFKTSLKVLNLDTAFEITGKILLPKLWSFESPSLYSLQILYGNKSRYETQFGFRSIESKNKMLYLNGKPFYLIGALDQDFYPETVYTTPSEKYIRDEMLKAKKLGLNTLRCHIKVPDPIYLKTADELGLLVWYEIPNWDILDEQAKIRSRTTLERMLNRDWNHPSLVIISLINESWGVDLQKADQRNWLKNEFKFAKEKAKGRLIVDNSACYGNFHIKTDLNDYHTYWSIPENFKSFDQTIEEVNKRPDWLFSKFGDAEESGEEPLLISEFGNWGLPQLPGKLPWWFDRRFGDTGPALPSGVEKRFKEFKYDQNFKNFNELAKETQWVQFNSLKHEIERIRLSSQIQGYVITEFTDINWESNGLMDMWRNPKVYEKDLSDIQQQDIIIPIGEKYNFWNGDTALIKIFFSHYSDKKIKGAVLSWKTSDGSSGETQIPGIKQTEVILAAKVNIPLKTQNECKKIKIYFELKLKEEVIAKNYYEVFVYPQIVKDRYTNIELYDPENLFLPIKSFFNVNETMNNDKGNKVIITNIIDQNILKRLNSGESVLCLVDSTTKLPEGFSIKFTSKEKDLYNGNWISNFNWLKRNRPLFDNLNFGNFLGFEAVNCEPKIVITDIEPENFKNVLAGMFVGWIHLNSGIIYQMDVGKGKLLLCTFPIAASIDKDPFSETLFKRIIEFCKSHD